jgi:hypothetical protein
MEEDPENALTAFCISQWNESMNEHYNLLHLNKCIYTSWAHFIYWLVLHTSNHYKADTILRFNKKFHKLTYW